jgi:hypothetical protein
MPRRPISDAHEWINEIPAVPVYYLAKSLPGERAWKTSKGKEDPFELDFRQMLCSDMRGAE